MRTLACTLFLSAAFDWPTPWLDRFGVAALGLAVLALATYKAPRARRPALPFRPPAADPFALDGNEHERAYEGTR